MYFEFLKTLTQMILQQSFNFFTLKLNASNVHNMTKHVTTIVGINK